MFIAYGCGGMFVSQRHSLLISVGLTGSGISPHTFIPAISSKGSPSTSIDVGDSPECGFGDLLWLGGPMSVAVL